MRTVEEVESTCAQLRETANKLWSRARLLELAVRGMYQKTTEDLKGWAITEAETEPACELAGEVERLAGEVFGFAEDFTRQPRVILPDGKAWLMRQLEGLEEAEGDEPA